MSLFIHSVLKHTHAPLQSFPMTSTFKKPHAHKSATSPPANYRSRDFPLLARYRIACLVIFSQEEKQLCIFESQAGLKSFFFLFQEESLIEMFSS